MVVQVIPRRDKDGLNLEWQPKKASDAELKSVKSRLQLYSDPIFLGKDTLPDIKVIDEGDHNAATHSLASGQAAGPAKGQGNNHAQHDNEQGRNEETDYMLKALKRMP